MDNKGKPHPITSFMGWVTHTLFFTFLPWFARPSKKKVDQYPAMVRLVRKKTLVGLLLQNCHHLCYFSGNKDINGKESTEQPFIVEVGLLRIQLYIYRSD